VTKFKVALIGAGSRSFGPGTIRDILLSPKLSKLDLEIALMDKSLSAAQEVEAYSKHVAAKLGLSPRVKATGELGAALDGANAVISAIEVNRYHYWAQDFHIPRKHGFAQVYGENGGPGGMFHALRNMGPTIEIAREMEKFCPSAPLLNFTNPETKLCEAVVRLTKINAVGLCHGVFMGMEQIAEMLGREEEDLEMTAAGMNHFTWFQKIRDRKTGEDLYPKLREVEREGDWLSDWHEKALARILLRTFGLWPSPAPNHYGEYLGWSEEFVATQLQYFYDPADGDPWKKGKIPEFVYSLTWANTKRTWRPEPERPKALTEEPLEVSGELAAPIMEAMATGEERYLDAVNVPNEGAVPNLPNDMVVEVPARAKGGEIKPIGCEPLPEAIAAIIRLNGSIHKLLVEAFAERSKQKLVQAVLLDPTVRSYRSAVNMVDEMLELQKEILPPLA